MERTMHNLDYISGVAIPIAQKYGIDRISLFGSRARGEESENSDYDFLITRGKIRTLIQLAGFTEELEKAFGGHVDVVTDTSNDPSFLEKIKKDEVVLYER